MTLLSFISKCVFWFIRNYENDFQVAELFYIPVVFLTHRNIVWWFLFFLTLIVMWWYLIVYLISISFIFLCWISYLFIYLCSFITSFVKFLFQPFGQFSIRLYAFLLATYEDYFMWSANILSRLWLMFSVFRQ